MRRGRGTEFDRLQFIGRLIPQTSCRAGIATAWKQFGNRTPVITDIVEFTIPINLRINLRSPWKRAFPPECPF